MLPLFNENDVIQGASRCITQAIAKHITTIKLRPLRKRRLRHAPEGRLRLHRFLPLITRLICPKW